MKEKEKDRRQKESYIHRNRYNSQKNKTEKNRSKHNQRPKITVYKYISIQYQSFVNTEIRKKNRDNKNVIVPPGFVLLVICGEVP